MIEVEDLTKNYKEFPALHKTSFTIGRKHGITALLGPNGAGKTTMLRILTGYLSPTNGKVRVGGLEMNTKNHVKIKQNIGYLPETTPLYPEMLLIEYLEFMGQARGLLEPQLSTNINEMIEILELSSHLYTPLGLLSKGFRQRVALAATLVHKPEYIILDEPTSGLDPNQIQQIRKLIQKLGKERTLILSTHVLQEVEDICDRVIIISRGKVVLDESTTVLQNAQSVRLVIRTESNTSKDMDLQRMESDGAKSKTANVSEVEKTLNSLDIVKGCKKIESLSNGFHVYVCELKEDRPQDLYKHISKLNWEVRELSPVSRSLQDVFQELTAK